MASLALSMSQDSRPTHCVLYPLLYNYRSLVNDFLLREVVELLRMRGQGALITPTSAWAPNSAERSHLTLEEGGGVLVCLSDTNVRHVGGMLMAHNNEFLFDAMPFIEKRVKDVRCRFGFSDTDAAPAGDDDDEDVKAALAKARRDIAALGGGGTGGASPGSGGGFGSAPSQERYHYDSERSRVYFMLCEYAGIGDDNDWVVQTLQLIGNSGPYGKVLYRAHLTGLAAGKLRQARIAAAKASSSPTNDSLAGDSDAAAVTARMPIPGEVYLREMNPELLSWCLKRDPVEMGAAARVIVNVIEYYKFSFTVIRTVKSLLKSIRCMQRFVRRFLAGRVTSELRMLRAWAEAERAFKRRLEAHVSLPGDQVDRIVNKMLLKNCMTTEQWKRDVIRGMWEDRKSRYRRERQLAGVGDAALEAIQGKFSWMIPIDELVAVNQARLVDMLSTTEKGVFSHPNVQALFIDSVGEAEILKQAVAEARDMQLRKLNGRRVAAFGSSVERFTGRPEHSLDINVPLAGPLIPSWDPRNYTDRPGDLEDSPEASEAATSDVVSGGPTPEARIGRGGAMGASAEHLPAFSPATTPRAGALPAVKGATASSPKRTAKPPAASPRGGDSAAVKLPPISPRKRAK